MTAYRAKELKISAVMQGQMNKRDAYKKLKAQFDVADEEICYVADDVIDLPVFVQVGFRAAVGDASAEVIERAHYVANTFGGLSGPAVLPVAIRMVYQVSHAVKIPVIGMGGIMSAENVLEFMYAGASAVMVGTASLIDPAAPYKILKDYEKLIESRNM